MRNNLKYILSTIIVLTLTIGIKAQTDYSNEKNITIAEPVFAKVWLSGIESMPVTKHDNLKGWMTYDDGNGNTFKKRVILNAQGNSSLMFDKKNISIQLCEDEWIGDKTTNLTIGDWVKQDEFHLKAYYNDAYRGAAVGAYHFYDQVTATLPHDKNRPWKIAGLSGDDNQRCHPDGFPCAVYLNEEFYGVYSWQLKKHRKNMNMDKATATHIHLDGTLYDATLFDGKVAWTKFEVRNPKTLYCMDGTVYDGDNPRELIDETSEYYDLASDDDNIRKAKHLTAEVKHYVGSLATLKAQIDALPTDDEKRAFVEEHFDVQNLIDYYIFSLLTNNCDGFIKNWQWITYDGKQWFVEPYDLDSTFGQMFTGQLLLPPEWGFVDDDFTMVNEYISLGPLMYVHDLFWDEMKQRYAELRDMQVATVDGIHGCVREWVDRIPSDFMAQEWQRWSSSPCINPTIANNGWHQLNDYTGWMEMPDYDNDKAYTKGDRVTINHSNDFSVWEAERDIKGVFPYQQVGYETNLNDLRDWIEKKIALIDDYLGYDNPSAIYEHQSGADGTVMERYSITGIRLNGDARGLVIEKTRNGNKTLYLHE